MVLLVSEIFKGEFCALFVGVDHHNFAFFCAGVVRVGEVDGEFVVNPAWSQLIISSLDLVVACSDKKVGKVHESFNLL